MKVSRSSNDPAKQLKLEEVTGCSLKNTTTVQDLQTQNSFYKVGKINDQPVFQGTLLIDKGDISELEIKRFISWPLLSGSWWQDYLPNQWF